ncbi:MAG: ComEC/Rec2 family competence protein [bacterium]
MHKSQVFFWLVLSFLAGVALSIIGAFTAGFILILGILLISISWRNKKFVLAGFCLIALFLGICRANLPDIKFNISFSGLLLQANASIEKILPEPQASFLAGLLFGLDKNIPKDLLEDFNKTGTRHIIALSGYNITIIASLIMSFLLWLGFWRKHAFYLSIIAIIFFVLVTGASASVVRAAVMGILVLIAQQFGRLSNPRNLLASAAFLMILKEPSGLLDNIGLQLSFAATIGIIYLSPYLKKLPEILRTTLSAQIAVSPLILFYFKQISLISPIANLLVLPIIPITMLFGFIALAISLLYLPIGIFLSWPAWLFLTYEIKIIELLAKVPFAGLNF